MPEVDQVVLWPSEENYPRFVELCDPAVRTYEEFVALAKPQVETLRAQGFNVIVVDPDLDDMVRWCMANFGNVDTAARAAYAASVELGKGTDGDSVH